MGSARTLWQFKITREGNSCQFLLLTQKMVNFVMQLRTAIKNCVSWSFDYTWNNAGIDALNVSYTPLALSMGCQAVLQ